MNSYSRGDIVLVRFPFTNLASSKLRPALVISSTGEDLIIVGIFSHLPEVMKETWVVIEETASYFPETGLKKTSLLKAERIAVIHQSVVKRRLSTLSNVAMEQINKAIKKALKLD